MCGILGWIDPNNVLENKREVFSNLMIFSSRRGKDSSGIWLYDDKKLLSSIKLPISGKKLIKTKEFEKRIEPLIDRSKVILGHCRLATNGKAEDLFNTQPLTKNDLILVHNGIIVNSDDLADEFKTKKHESDSRVLLDVVSKIKTENKIGITQTIKKISKYLVGTLNLVVLDKSNPKKIEMVFASNNGSLYIGKFKSAILFASEKKFLEKLKIRKINISKVGPGKIITANLDGGWKESILDKTDILETKSSTRKKINDLTNHEINFKKILKIKRCVKCVLPETTPFINFDKNGICNYCNEHKEIKHKGVNALEKIIKNYRSRDNNPDCIIAFSGGRDSSFGLHYLVKVLKMHPVAVTFDWGMLSDVGRRNQSRMLAKLGVEHIVVSADIKKAREDIKMNLKAWLKRPKLGMIPLLMQGDKTTEYYVDKIKKELGVKLVFFCRGNELEKEEFKSGYCGVKNADPGGVIHNYYWLDKLKLLTYYVKEFLLNPAYLNRSLWSSFLGYLITFVVPHDYIYLWHYIPWDENEIIKTLKEEYNWEGDSETGLTWRIDDGSPAFYNYVYCQIQGFTENDSFRSHQIREGIITRDEALKLIYKENMPRYNSLKWYFDSIKIDGNKVLSVIDKIKKRY